MKCCKEIGLVSTSLKLSRMAYAPGETLDISGKVVNDTGKQVLVKLVLRQDVELQSGSRISGSRSATGYSPRSSRLVKTTISSDRAMVARSDCRVPLTVRLI